MNFSIKNKRLLAAVALVVLVSLILIFPRMKLVKVSPDAKYQMINQGGSLHDKLKFKKHIKLPDVIFDVAKVGDIVIVQTISNKIVAVPISGDEIAWEYLGEVDLLNRLKLLETDDNSVYLNKGSSKIISLNIDDGTEIWSLDLPISLTARAHFKLVGELLVLADTHNRLAYIIGINPSTGEILWESSDRLGGYIAGGECSEFLVAQLFDPKTNFCLFFIDSLKVINSQNGQTAKIFNLPQSVSENVILDREFLFSTSANKQSMWSLDFSTNKISYIKEQCEAFPPYYSASLTDDFTYFVNGCNNLIIASRSNYFSDDYQTIFMDDISSNFMAIDDTRGIYVNNHGDIIEYEFVSDKKYLTIDSSQLNIGLPSSIITNNKLFIIDSIILAKINGENLVFFDQIESS